MFDNIPQLRLHVSLIVVFEWTVGCVELSCLPQCIYQHNQIRTETWVFCLKPTISENLKTITLILMPTFLLGFTLAI